MAMGMGLQNIRSKRYLTMIPMTMVTVVVMAMAMKSNDMTLLFLACNADTQLQGKLTRSEKTCSSLHTFLDGVLQKR